MAFDIDSLSSLDEPLPARRRQIDQRKPMSRAAKQALGRTFQIEKSRKLERHRTCLYLVKRPDVGEEPDAVVRLCDWLWARGSVAIMAEVWRLPEYQLNGTAPGVLFAKYRTAILRYVKPIPFETAQDAREALNRGNPYRTIAPDQKSACCPLCGSPRQFLD